jgi:hypothetical protein
VGKGNHLSQGLIKLVLVTLLGTFSFILHTWLRTRVVTSSFEVAASRKELTRLENDLIALQSLRESKMSPQKLLRLRERWADQGQFYVEARPEQIIFLKEPSKEGIH